LKKKHDTDFSFYLFLFLFFLAMGTLTPDLTATQSPNLTTTIQEPAADSNNNSSQDPNTQLREYKGIQYSFDEPRFKGLSKNAIKRLLRDQLWEKTRPERLQVKREKHKKRISEKRKQYELGNAPPPPKRTKTADMVFGNRTAIIDCSFSDYMTKKVKPKKRGNG
jgi:tRNA (guanine9-N1)-methyltransferase